MSNPPHHPSYPSSSSSTRPAADADDLTWLDFLRTAGGTMGGEQARATRTTASTADRKRRQSGPSPERRGYPYPPQYANTTGRRLSGMSAAGGSSSNAIDLISPSPPRHRPQMPHGGSGSGSSESMRVARQGIRGEGLGGSTRAPRESSRRDSDHILPRWQPDAEVSKCPVCHTEFHFFYRKHHCRKCGRVVCAACSPHRITIPKQYIVQPPSGSDGEDAAPSSPSGGLFARNNLGGGDVVRVCNPCVPDPWTPESAASALEARHPADGSGRRRGSDQASHQPDRYRNIFPPVPPLPDNSSSRARAHTHQPPPTPFSRSVPQHPFIPLHPSNPQHRAAIAPMNPPARSSSHRYSQSSGSHAPLPPIPQHSRPPMPTAPSAPPPPRHRREIREEDECPVCGTELPPGPALREAHIQSCITDRFSASSLPTSTSTSAPLGASTRPSFPGASPSAIQTGPSPFSAETMPTRPRATSYRPRGMAVYRATEKDCVSEDGEAQECVICFEEFQPGDEMGRMECLCKFHRGCIRRWWEARGGGSCPTHQVYGG